MSKGFRPGVREFAVRSASTLVEAIASELGKEQNKQSLDSLDLIELGAVYINDVRSLNPSQSLKSGDQIRIHTNPRRYQIPFDLTSRIISETEDTLLIEKPFGIPSEPQVDNIKENLLSHLEDLRGQHLYLTHRLSTETDGLMLIAKNREAAERIIKSFKLGTIRRRYAAYLQLPMDPGEYHICENKKPMIVLSCQAENEPTHLLTESRKTWRASEDPINLRYRIEIEFTGFRPQDVRAYFGEIKNPIIGDQSQGSEIRLIDTETEKASLAFRAVLITAPQDE